MINEMKKIPFCAVLFASACAYGYYTGIEVGGVTYGYEEIDSKSVKLSIIDISAEHDGNVVVPSQITIPYLNIGKTRTVTTISEPQVNDWGTRRQMIVGIALPDTVTTATERFMQLPELQSIDFGNGLTALPDYTCYEASKLTTVRFGSALQTIGAHSFENCTALKQLTIPSTVISIGANMLNGCGGMRIVFDGEPPAGCTASGMLNLAQSTYYFPQTSSGLWNAARQSIGLTSNRTSVEIISSKMRANDPTIMDVVYKPYRRFNVTGADPDVKVRALAFQDGERSFWKVVRATEFVNDPDGNPTAQNIGDNIEPNVEHKLAWKVSKDWKTDLAKVKFEVLCSDQAQLPLKLNHIKAVGKYPALTIGVGTQTDADIFNALLWHYAAGVEDLINTDGYVDLDHPYPNQVDTTNIRIVNRTTIANRMEALRYIYEKMGYEPLEGGNLLSYARTATRKDLWFNSGTQNAVVLKSSKPEQLYVGEKAYCVIDVSGGPDAEKYPVTYLDYEPTAGWSDEYKTTKILLRRCEAGQYMMQNNKQVTLTKPFYMGVFTVTQKQYMQVMGTNPTQSGHQGDMRPVEISWNAIRGDSTVYNWPTVKTVDPNTFVGKIQTKTGLSFDLPTEAQWEYACRAGTNTNYGNGGNSDTDLRRMSRFWASWVYAGSNKWNNPYASVGMTSVPIGLYLPNLWGVYDMQGSVGQWCLDYYEGYCTDADVDYQGAIEGELRSIRGCYFDYYIGNYSCHCDATSTCRYGYSPSGCYYYYTNHSGTYFGFRLSVVLSE